MVIAVPRLEKAQPVHTALSTMSAHAMLAHDALCHACCYD